MSAEQAPRIDAGFVLSQPVRRTTPSRGYDRIDSSTSIAMRLRYSIVVGFISASPSDITGNSRGKPPACSTPRLTASAKPRRWMLQLTSSDQELQMPITGRPRNASSVTPVDFSHERCRKPSRPPRSSQRALRRLPACSGPSLRIVLEDDLGDDALPMIHQPYSLREVAHREMM